MVPVAMVLHGSAMVPALALAVSGGMLGTAHRKEDRPMHPERIRELFLGMRDEHEGGINTFIQSAVINAMVGRSMQAAIPVMEDAHRILEKGGPVSLGDGCKARALICPEGPHGGIWRKAFVLGSPAGLLLTVLEVSGEPNPVLDRIVEDALAAKGVPRGEREPRQPGPCRDIKVYAVRDEQEMAEALRADVHDRWSHHMMLKSSLCIPPYGDDTAWHEWHNDTVQRPGIDRWAAYFSQVRTLFGATGLSGAMEASVAEVSARRWKGSSRSGHDYDSAQMFGTEAAYEDGYLPSARCTASLAKLDQMAAEHSMGHMAVGLDTLAGQLASHPSLPRDGRYAANDMRDHARLAEGGGSSWVIELEDQNSTFRIVRRGTEIRVCAWRADEPDAPACIDSLFLQEGTGWRMDAPPSPDACAIRSWNSLTGLVPTLVLNLQEDLADLQEAAAPPGP